MTTQFLAKKFENFPGGKVKAARLQNEIAPEKNLI